MTSDDSAPVAEMYREVVAANLRAYRARRKFSQEALAERMRELGFQYWLRQTVGLAETGQRGIRAEELMALASVLEVVPPGRLLDAG